MKPRGARGRRGTRNRVVYGMPGLRLREKLLENSALLARLKKKKRGRRNNVAREPPLPVGGRGTSFIATARCIVAHARVSSETGWWPSEAKRVSGDLSKAFNCATYYPQI